MPTPEPSTHAIFVYGTLKRGGSNHRLMKGQRFTGLATTGPGYQLYQLDGYPGMVVDPTATRPVFGEVWEVDAACLQRLDVLEGVAEGLYRREEVVIANPPVAGPIETYLYARSTAGRTRCDPDWPVG